MLTADHTKINRVASLIARAYQNGDANWANFVAFGETWYLFVDRGRICSAIYFEKEDLINGISQSLDSNTFSRGTVLDIFTQLELILDEIIFLHLNIKRTEKAPFVDLLKELRLLQKIRLLHKWGTPNLIHNKLEKLNEARNDYAHSIVPGEYKGMPIYPYQKNSSAEEFKKDLNEVWTYFVEELKPMQPSLDQIIAELTSNP